MRVAVVGFGPRGLAAVEALLAHRGQTPLTIDIFDPIDTFGAGPNFAVTEHPGCLLNLPIRDVQIGTPAAFAFPTFQTWHDDPDHNAFLPRARLGTYLTARFQALQEALPEGVTLSIHRRRVTALYRDDRLWTVKTKGTTTNGYDEVLLAMGQPETQDDAQMARWQDHATRHGLDCLDAYPTDAVIAAADRWTDKSVAIRGLGLSTLDILSLLTTGRGGVMREGKYIASGHEPKCILPFSLDGLAPAPKPMTQALAQQFVPTSSESEAFVAALKQALSASAPDTALQALIGALHAPAHRVTGQDPTSWLQTEIADPGTQRGTDPIAALQADLAMATGARAPSVGYAVGQIWRGWQDTLRGSFRTQRDTDEDVRTAIIGFDGALKRYSYGPPVRDAQMLLALVEAGRVVLSVANDPDIVLGTDGWHLDSTHRAQVMINSVLAPAALPPVTEPLINMLRDANCLVAHEDVGGVVTDTSGRVIDSTGSTLPGLSLLGRLAEGSVIAVDSIHDCFGDSTAAWAKAVMTGT